MTRTLSTLASLCVASSLVMIAAPAGAQAPDAQAPQDTPQAPVSTPAPAAPPTGATTPASEQGAASPATTPPASGDGEPKADKPSLKVTPIGYVEAYYAYNFNRPSNGITNFRGFDNRHNTFTLSNAALGANLEAGPVGGRLMLQVGSTPSTYYLGRAHASRRRRRERDEPRAVEVHPGGVRHVQGAGRTRALAAARPLRVADRLRDVRGQGQLELVALEPLLRPALLPDGPARDVRVDRRAVDDRQRLQRLEHRRRQQRGEERRDPRHLQIPDKVLVQALYFGGIERTTGAPEGPYWRHHFDVLAQVDATTWLSLAGQGDYGWEPNRIGTAKWVAGALYARVKPVDKRLPRPARRPVPRAPRDGRRRTRELADLLGRGRVGELRDRDARRAAARPALGPARVPPRRGRGSALLRSQRPGRRNVAGSLPRERKDPGHDGARRYRVVLDAAPARRSSGRTLCAAPPSRAPGTRPRLVAPVASGGGAGCASRERHGAADP